jgi:uncharacterized membrane protein
MTKRKHHDIHARTLAKAVTWKLLATILAFSTTYYYTGSAEIAGRMVGTTFFLGLLAYYAHERVWNAVHWGRETSDN